MNMKARTKTQKVSRASVWTLVAAVSIGASVPARAYDPATTHAGLTERSVTASGLHKVLARRLGLPLGLFEPVRLGSGAENERSLRDRLTALDPADGYRPASDGTASALAWIVAGSVIANTPAERGRNLFYDPSRGTGLRGEGDGAAFSHAVRSLFDDGTFRSLATGTDFNLTGLPATEWLASPQNDVGLAVFARELEAAVASADPAARGAALARALLALGGTLAVLQDAGEPAHVRNDFVGAYLSDGAGRADNPFDRASAFERFVADRYGRLGLPASGAPVSRPSVTAFITAEDRQGLADRTQRRFFSPGTVPGDARRRHEGRARVAGLRAAAAAAPRARQRRAGPATLRPRGLAAPARLRARARARALLSRRRRLCRYGAPRAARDRSVWRRPGRSPVSRRARARGERRRRRRRGAGRARLAERPCARLRRGCAWASHGARRRGPVRG
jgi:hypothetical protein